MADNNENAVRLTRAAAAAAAAVKRAAGSGGGQPFGKRKREALADLSNFGNASAEPNPCPVAKRRTRAGKTKEEVPRSPPSPPLETPRSPPSLPLEKEEDFCLFYASEILQYLLSMEADPKRRPKPDFIEKVQTDVTPNMRGILVDWLVEVALEYTLVADTLYLTVSFIDRFLSFNALNRQKLQLLGVSAMLIASKYEEITPPHVEDFCYITDNTYTKQEVVKMESDILKFLNFEMGNPTIKTFLRRFVKVDQDNKKYTKFKLECMANYVAELSLVDYGCVRFLPSVVAASAVFVARFTLDPDSHPWSLALQHHTGYKPCKLKDCILALHNLQLNWGKSSLTAVGEKYKQHPFSYVSALLPHSEIPTSYFEGF